MKIGLGRGYGNSVSNAASAGKQLAISGQIPPDRVRAAQLVITSLAMEDVVSLADALLDDALQAEIREALAAVGIFNKERRVITRAGKRPIGLTQDAVPARYRGKREPSGRLSRKKGKET
jgi:hypothetical protein